jgi:hypothetical protein
VLLSGFDCTPVLYHHTFQVNAASFFLHKVANIYVSITGRYVLPNLAQLSRLLSADRNDDVRRDAMLANITRDSNDAREGITRMFDEMGHRYKHDLEVSCPTQT